MRQADLPGQLVVPAGKDQLIDPVLDLPGVDRIKDKSLFLLHNLLIKLSGVDAVQVQPYELGIADGMVFMRLVTVEHTRLPCRRDHCPPAACQREPAVADVEHHIVVIVLPLDAVIIIGVVIAARRHVVQHPAGHLAWRLEMPRSFPSMRVSPFSLKK